jgi:hypothetical protein
MIEAGVDVLIYEGTSDFICGLEAVRAVAEGQDLIPREVEKQMKVWKGGLGRYVCSGKKTKGHFVTSKLPIEYDGWPDILERWVLRGSVA